MLEAVGLRVDVLDAEAEGVGEVQLEQTVVPDHLECDLRARRCEARAAVGLVLEQAEHGELLQHRRGRCGRDALVARERRDGRAAPGFLEFVDPLQVVLDRLGERRPAHQGASVAAPVY